VPLKWPFQRRAFKLGLHTQPSHISNQPSKSATHQGTPASARFKWGHMYLDGNLTARPRSATPHTGSYVDLYCDQSYHIIS